MYSAKGVSYTEEHSVSFGDIITKTSDGRSYMDFDSNANTWTDWHLIPSSRPIVSNTTPVYKFIEIPGSDGVIDLTDYLIGRATHSQRQGTFSFIIDIDQETSESIRSKMINILHGKRIKMMLHDDPTWYYEGRFTVGNVEASGSYPAISINYQLDPYKYHIGYFGSYPVLWDPFNFETDYDYSVAFYPYLTVSGATQSYPIYANDYPVTPKVTWVSGSVTVAFGGVTKTLTSAGSETLGTIMNSSSNLKVSGVGSVLIEWVGGSL